MLTAEGIHSLNHFPITSITLLWPEILNIGADLCLAMYLSSLRNDSVLSALILKDGKAVVLRCDEEIFQKRNKTLIIVYTRNAIMAETFENQSM